MAIRVDDISREISKYLDKYVEDIHDQVVEVTEDLSEQAVQDLKESSKSLFKTHNKSRPYWRGWEAKMKVKGKRKYHRVIWNRTNYQLTHLLEKGHTTRDGGHTTPKPHIQPVEQKYQAEYIKQIQDRIRRVH